MDNLISHEIAVAELKKMILEHDENTVLEHEIEKLYPDALKAICSGNLIFDDSYIPTLKLSKPILDNDGQVVESEVVFKTRIKPQTLSDITKGLNIAQNQMEYSLRCISYLTGLPKGLINNLGKKDYKTVEQISSVFM